jgi:cytochrome c biogenesis protein CcmG, thiol:disulfide interchange protein DsbE
MAVGCNRGAHPSQPGTRAPDFTVSDGATTVHLASYRGQVVLLNFWASWCAPCVAETPSLLQLHHQMPKLVILGVSIDDDAEAYRQFVKSHHIDFITVLDTDESAPHLFHTDMWPETYLIDRKGMIRSKFIGAQDWADPEIRALIKSL